MCIGKEVKSNSGQHCSARVLGTGRAGDCTALGLLGSVTGTEPPLCCGNIIQILISSCHPTLLPASRICALSPRVASGCLLVLWDLEKMFFLSCQQTLMVTGLKKQ